MFHLKAKDLLIEEINKRRIDILDDNDLKFIAKVASNNDEEISNNIVKAVKVSGMDGMIFIEDSPTEKTEIKGEKGFLMEIGFFSPYLVPKGQFTIGYNDIPVFITDKRLYYEEEVIAILEFTAKLGYTGLTIVAKDFIGQAPNILISNHLDPKVNMNINLIKCPEDETLWDLATYLGGEVFSEKEGSLVGKLKDNHFSLAQKVFSDVRKTLFVSPKEGNIGLNILTQNLKKEIETANDAEKQKLEKRLACLTSGIITIKVGGNNRPEITEKLYRYEDGINATRNAMKTGYVIGGGLTLNDVFQELKDKKLDKLFKRDVVELIERFCQAPLKQIAKNCNLHFETLLEKATDKVGYNAVSEKYEDLWKAGIIEPILVLTKSVENSFSVAKIILSSGFLIINKEEKNEDKNTKN